MKTTKLMTPDFRMLAAAAALAAATAIGGGGGCKSTEKTEAVGETADLAEHNRLLVRMALAENVYNGIATERAVYPKDFRQGTAQLNELGTRRVAMLIDICRDATTSVVIVRGDEPDKIYEARVNAVRTQLADAGLAMDEIEVGAHGPVGGVGASSNRALLTYTRMLTDYMPRQNGGGGGGAGAAPAPGGAGAGMGQPSAAPGGSSRY